MNLRACFDELLKLGAVSDEQAQSAVDRLDTLERNKPGPDRVARYAAIGAASAPVIGAVGKAIVGKQPGSIAQAVKPTVTQRARVVAADAAKGAIGAGAIPLVQQHFDRQREIGTLKQYLTQHEAQDEQQA